MQPSPADRHAAPNPPWRPFWPLGIALAVRLALWLLLPASRLASDEDGYVPAGLALFATGTQDLFWPPVTGWIVAAVAAVAGPSVRAIRLVWILMDAACLIALGVLAGRLTAAAGFDAARRERVRRYAMFGYALYLPAISFSQFATSEIPALLQTLLILVLVATASPSMARSAAAGLLGGTLILTRPSVLPVALLVPAALALRWPRPLWLRHAAVMLAGTAVVVGALLLKNWQERGELTIAQNSAYNLYIGNRALYAEDLNLFSPRATAEQIEFRRSVLQRHVAGADRLAGRTAARGDSVDRRAARAVRAKSYRTAGAGLRTENRRSRARRRRTARGSLRAGVAARARARQPSVGRRVVRRDDRARRLVARG